MEDEGKEREKRIITLFTHAGLCPQAHYLAQIQCKIVKLMSKITFQVISDHNTFAKFIVHNTHFPLLTPNPPLLTLFVTTCSLQIEQEIVALLKRTVVEDVGVTPSFMPMHALNL